MNLVIRDFAPLDSLIQVAGRCNRNGGPERGTVEIVRLLDDRNGRALSEYVYTDKIQLQITDQVLGDRDSIDEESIFELTRQYYQELAQRKDVGESISRSLIRWEDPGQIGKRNA